MAIRKDQAGYLNEVEWQIHASLEKMIDRQLNRFASSEPRLPSTTVSLNSFARELMVEINPKMVPIIIADYEAAGWTVSWSGTNTLTFS